MFPAPREILRRNEGDFVTTPFPLILNAIRAEERTCTLVLKVRALEKGILFEEGRPIAFASNILHETIGRFLVDRKKLPEDGYREALVESVKAGVRLEDWLVRNGRIAPFELYRQLQANLAVSVLDCFRWRDARWRLDGTIGGAPTPMPMNAEQLVLTGVLGHMPFDVLAAHFAFPNTQRFAAAADAVASRVNVKLGPRETKLLARLRARPSFGELLDEDFDPEEALRGLFALTLLGLAGRAEEIVEPATATATAPAAAAAATAAPSAPIPPSPPGPMSSGADALPGDDARMGDLLIGEYLLHTTRDAFDLLDVPPGASPASIRLAFLTRATRFSPARFQAADLREKAEVLLIAWAQAFVELSDAEAHARARRRREAAASAAAQGPARKAPSEFFRISTDLLDAPTQFVEAMKRFEAADYRGAAEYFEYAADIEPKAEYRAWLALARYRAAPHAAAKSSLQELSEAERDEPDCVEVPAFRGEIAAAQGLFADAEAAYLRAFKLAPEKTEYVDRAREARRRSQERA